MSRPRALRRYTYASGAVMNAACTIKTLQTRCRANLQLRTRRILTRAIILVMRRKGCSPDQAVDTMTGVAEQQDSTLLEVAADIVNRDHA